MGTLMIFNCLYYYAYVDIAFWNVIFSNLKLKIMFLLIFKNSGKSILSQKVCNDYFFQDKIHIKIQSPLPKSMKIVWNFLPMTFSTQICFNGVNNNRKSMITTTRSRVSFFKYICLLNLFFTETVYAFYHFFHI